MSPKVGYYKNKITGFLKTAVLYGPDIFKIKSR